jgi:tetratricopeptide (TPR) repeat protein
VGTLRAVFSNVGALLADTVGMKSVLGFGLLALLGLLCGCKPPVPLPPKAVELNRLGAVAFSRGDLETAEVRFALAIEYHPRFTEAWVNLGWVELGRGNFVRAKKDFQKAKGLNGDVPTPHHALGVLEDRLGDVAAAEKHYRAALKVDPGFAPARANLGRLLFDRGRYDDAREQFERLTEAAPDSELGWIGLCESLFRLGREEDAVRALSRGREHVGDTPDAILLLARQLLRHGAAAEAENALAPLTYRHDASRQAAAWAWIALARLSRGRVESAVQAASEALQANRDDVVANHAMSLALRAEGLPALAEHWTDRARTLAASR